MGIAAQPGAPTTLADLLDNLRVALLDMGDNTPVLIGRNYKGRGPGDIDPRVLITPYLPGSKITGDAREQGSVGSINGKCEVQCRGRDAADDVERFRDAERLLRRVFACLRALAPGMVFDGGPLEDTSPVDVSGYGFELTFTFTYKFDVWHDADFWAVQQAADTSPATPEVPGGSPMGLQLDGSVTPTA